MISDSEEKQFDSDGSSQLIAQPESSDTVSKSAGARPFSIKVLSMFLIWEPKLEKHGLKACQRRNAMCVYVGTDQL